MNYASVNWVCVHMCCLCNEMMRKWIEAEGSQNKEKKIYSPQLPLDATEGLLTFHPFLVPPSHSATR